MNYIRTRLITCPLDNDHAPYSVDCIHVGNGDTLIVNVVCELRSIRRSFRFYGADIIYRDAVEFNVKEQDTDIEIEWVGANPILNYDY